MMGALVLDPAEPLSAGFRAEVARLLEEFCAPRVAELRGIDPSLAPVAEHAVALLAGGKRVRPAFCVWGHAAVAPPADVRAVVVAAASIELLHASALVHDDLIDDSDTRRGEPAAHRWFAGRHRADGLLGDAAEHGRAMAVLLGDLLLMWSVEMLDGCGLPSLDAGRGVMARMRTEVTAGQLLDVWAAVKPPTDGQARRVAEHVVEFKTTRYTVVRPLQLGVALAGGDAAAMEWMERIGSPLGRAFQYRDDVLGVFGAPSVTGKPAGDDIREGKRTVLVAETLARLEGRDRTRFVSLLGRAEASDDDVVEARSLMDASGARARVEDLIAESRDTCLAAIQAASIRSDAAEALTQLALAAAHRDK